MPRITTKHDGSVIYTFDELHQRVADAVRPKIPSISFGLNLFTHRTHVTGRFTCSNWSCATSWVSKKISLVFQSNAELDRYEATVSGQKCPSCQTPGVLEMDEQSYIDQTECCLRKAAGVAAGPPPSAGCQGSLAQDGDGFPRGGSIPPQRLVPDNRYPDVAEEPTPSVIHADIATSLAAGDDTQQSEAERDLGEWYARIAARERRMLELEAELNTRNDLHPVVVKSMREELNNIPTEIRMFRTLLEIPEPAQPATNTTSSNNAQKNEAERNLEAEDRVEIRAKQRRVFVLESEIARGNLDPDTAAYKREEANFIYEEINHLRKLLDIPKPAQLPITQLKQ